MTNIPTAVIGASGPSLRRSSFSRIPEHAYIIRVNNFFLEREYHIGSKVDCVYFSGDRRALRFYAATLRKIVRLGIYQVGAFASHHPEAISYNMPAVVKRLDPRSSFLQRAGEKAGLDPNFQPTSGIMAAVYAHEIGYKRILFAGVDLYMGHQRYFATLPPRLRSILEPNAQGAFYDAHLHSREIDEAIVRAIMRDGTEVFTLDADTTSTLLELAPEVSHPLSISAKKDNLSVQDWVGRDGFYPLWFLLRLRWFKRVIKRSLKVWGW